MPTRVICGHIHNYDVVVTGQSIGVLEGDTMRARHFIDLTEFLTKARDIRLAWAEFPDFEVIYVYDLADDRFGYGLNLDDPDLSEWGYAPFTGEEGQ